MKFKATVINGVSLGAKFGVATANLDLAAVPESFNAGVYFVQVALGNDVYQGLLHFGARKTFGGDVSAEVHLLDFDQDIYGETLEVEVLKRWREVMEFRNGDALFTQIEKDIVNAQKFFVRREVRAAWQGLSLHDQQVLTEEAVMHVGALAVFLEAKTVFAYAPQLNKEIGFVAALMQAFPEKTYAFPRINAGTMEFVAVPDYGVLQPGAFGILEPVTGEVEILPEAASVMLVPAVAMTRLGDRLGQGGGFYDAYLAAHDLRTIAVVPDFAVREALPTEKHDQRVESVVVCSLSHRHQGI